MTHLMTPVSQDASFSGDNEMTMMTIMILLLREKEVKLPPQFP